MGRFELPCFGTVVKLRNQLLSKLVSVLDTPLSGAKTAESTEMPFKDLDHVDPEMGVTIG